MYSGHLPIGHDCYAWYNNKIILIIHLISMFGLLLNLLLIRMLHSNFTDEVNPRPVNMQRNIITGTWRPASRKVNNILPNISHKISTFCKNLSPGPTSVSCVATFPLHTSALCRLWSVERVLLQEFVTKSGDRFTDWGGSRRFTNRSPHYAAPTLLFIVIPLRYRSRTHFRYDRYLSIWLAMYWYGIVERAMSWALEHYNVLHCKFV